MAYAMDWRGLRFEIRKRNFTSIPCARHPRFLQRVHLSLQKHHACHEIMSRGHAKCWTGHAKPSSSSSSSNAASRRNWALGCQNMGSMVRIPCGLSRKTQPFEWHAPANVLATSTQQRQIWNICPVRCTWDVNSRFWPHVTDSLHLPCKMKFMSADEHEHRVKRCLRNCDFRDGRELSPQSAQLFWDMFHIECQKVRRRARMYVK